MGVINLIRWLERLRVDKPDMLGTIEEVLDGFRNLCRRALDSDIAGDIWQKPPTGDGGHVLHGFSFDFTGGLADVQFGRGTFFDQYGLPVDVAATGIGTGVDFSAYGAGAVPALWATWYHVQDTNVNRVFWDAGIPGESLIGHDSREGVQTQYAVTANSGVVPAGPHNWTLIHDFAFPNPLVLADITSQPNCVLETWQRTLGIGDDTWYPDGVAGYRAFDAIEQLRQTVAVLKKGVDDSTWPWVLPCDVSTLCADLTALKSELETGTTGWINVPCTNIIPRDPALGVDQLIVSPTGLPAAIFMPILTLDWTDVNERFAWLHCDIPCGCVIQDLHAVVTRVDVPGKTEEIVVNLLKRNSMSVAGPQSWDVIAECSLVAGNFPIGTKISDGGASPTLPFTVPVAASEDDEMEFCLRVGIKNNSARTDVEFWSAVIEIDYAPIDLRV